MGLAVHERMHSSSDIDLCMFRVEVLVGKVIYCENERFLHDIAWEAMNLRHSNRDPMIGEKPI
ncbi:MAG TPA: hypothetical protein PLO64_07000 [Methanothermobacter sp.]|nr:conserved hypothetical protein [Methanothermobacter sp. MT-2]HOK72801.1 hypothetical protein [Methanothermobacter sp.]HOL69661.1 hypothetical protein [Methanothermobacter sp.]HPQ05267.1 hypothetical protein [Methanothermobacter sp.]HPU37886.1 hypothetical protein [Methanothermobacter sp.]